MCRLSLYHYRIPNGIKLQPVLRAGNDIRNYVAKQVRVVERLKASAFKRRRSLNTPECVSGRQEKSSGFEESPNPMRAGAGRE